MIFNSEGLNLHSQLNISMSKKDQEFVLTEEDLRRINSKEGILEILKAKEYKLDKILNELGYLEEMEGLDHRV